MAIRVTQNASEAVILPTSQALRVTQAVAEPVVSPTSQLLRMTQAVAEPVILPTNQKLRVTAIVAEIIITNLIETCEEAWTFPTVAAYPLPANGGPYYLYFDEIEPDWGNYGQLMPDGNPLFGTLQTSRIRYFVFDYDGLTKAEAEAMDAHYASTSGALSFTLTHPLTAEVITGVRYFEYSRGVHRKSWSQGRSVKLVKYTN